MAQRFEPSDVRAFLARDWALLRRLKRQHWRSEIDREGLAGSLRLTEDLRLHAEANNPTWPTKAHRDEDLASHTRVAKALAQTGKTDRR